MATEKRDGKSKNTTQRLKRDKKTAFLELFARCGNVTRASDEIGLDRGRHYAWLRKDEEYRAKFAEAEQRAARNLEDEAYERAITGARRPVLHDGKQVMLPEKRIVTVIGEDGVSRETETEVLVPLFEYQKSDTLLIFLLKGLKPDRYRDQVAVMGKDGQPIGVDFNGLRKLLETTPEPPADKE